MSKAFSSKLGDKDNVVGQTVSTVCVTNKAIVPHKYRSRLNEIYSVAQKSVKSMLANSSNSSTKHYPELPSVVAKSLIVKYQKNKKIKSVKRLVLPICGDQGRVIKLDSNNQIRIPFLTEKETFAINPLKPIIGHIRSVEFFRRKGVWYMSYTYNTPVNPIETNGFIGVDRNARDNVATVADIESGKVCRLGPDVKLWKDNIKHRKSKLQNKGKKKLLVKINRKQSNRTKDINHKVSKQIVDFATFHRKAIALENLGTIKDSKKCGRYVKGSQWSYYQLEQFITYKASLRGIPVVYVDPRNTSKACSRCGTINDVGSSKKYVCNNCGHKDHRDANAAFNIAQRGLEHIDGATIGEREPVAGRIDAPYTGQGEFAYGR